MKCTHCGFEISEAIKFCPNCGTANAALQAEVEPVEDIQPPEAAPLEPSESVAPPEPTPVEEIPQPGGGFIPPAFPVSAGPSWKKLPLWMLIVGGVVVLGLLAAGVVLAANLLGGGAAGNQILLGLPSRSGEMDLYALKLGEPLKDAEPMLEGGTLVDGGIYQLLPDGQFHALGAPEMNSGFLQGSQQLVLGYQVDGDTRLYFTRPNPKDLQPVYEGDDDFYALILEDGKTLFIHEDRGSSERCYISQNGQEAGQAAKGDRCSISWSGNLILVSDISSRGKLTLTSYDLNGKNETVLLEDEPNIRPTSVDINRDGSWISLLVEDGDREKVRLISTRNGEVLAESEAFENILTWGSAWQGSAYYFIGETEKGELELYTFADQEQKRVASGASLMAQLDRSGENLVYLTGDEDDQQTLAVHPMQGGEDVTVIEGEELSFYLLTAQDTILIRERNIRDEEVTFYSAKTDGSGRTDIFSDAVVRVNNLYLAGDGGYLLVEVVNQDSLINLFAARLGSDEGDYLLEDWSAIQFLNLHTRSHTLLLSGEEDRGDDRVLFTLDLTGKQGQVDLDDDDIQRIVSAVFSANGKTVLYTVSTGPNYDDYEVRQVGLDGKEDYEVLYEEAILLDTSWSVMDPFDYIWFPSAYYGRP